MDPSPPLDGTGLSGRPAVRRVVHLRAAPRVRRRLGLALTAYGVLGLGLIVPLLILLAGPLGSTGGVDARRELIATIEDARGSLRDATVAARDSRSGLDSAATAAGSTGDFMTQLGGTLRGLATALRVQLPLIGTAPFAGVAGGFGDLADRADGLATNLEAVRTSVSTSAEDLERLADDLDRLEGQLGKVSAAVSDATGNGVDTARLIAIALLGWLAVPAGVSLWLGLVWLRRVRRDR